jgi:hypothetical protein
LIVITAAAAVSVPDPAAGAEELAAGAEELVACPLGEVVEPQPVRTARATPHTQDMTTLRVGR